MFYNDNDNKNIKKNKRNFALGENDNLRFNRVENNKINVWCCFIYCHKIIKAI